MKLLHSIFLVESPNTENNTPIYMFSIKQNPPIRPLKENQHILENCYELVILTEQRPLSQTREQRHRQAKD